MVCVSPSLFSLSPSYFPLSLTLYLSIFFLSFSLSIFLSLSLTLSLSFCVICTCGKSRGKQLQMRPGSFRKEPADSDERGVIKRVPVSMPDIHPLSFSSVFRGSNNFRSFSYFFFLSSNNDLFKPTLHDSDNFLILFCRTNFQIFFTSFFRSIVLKIMPLI